MKTLYVVRHAKSSWEYHELPDMDRPLKGRGIRDAHLMASWLQDLLTEVPVLYASPATRTLHTAMIFARTLGIPLDEVRVAESLYSASHFDIAAFLRGIQGEPGSIMLFGHNPGMSEFISDCVPGFTETCQQAEWPSCSLKFRLGMICAARRNFGTLTFLKTKRTSFIAWAK